MYPIVKTGETPSEPTPHELPTDLQFRQALHKKIRKYNGGGHTKNGGVEGVWEMLDPLFKKENKYGQRLTKAAFSRAVSRLGASNHDKEEAFSRRITLGIKGNIVLLMNIFEILGIKSLIDLDLHGSFFEKPDINGVIMGISKDMEQVNRRLEVLSSDVERMAGRRPSRMKIFEVCWDCQNIFSRIHEIINNKVVSNSPAFYQLLNMNIDFAQRINSDEYFKLGTLTYYLFNDYRKYLSQDKILYQYIKMLSTKSFGDPDFEGRILVCPLYILYFFLKMNNRFLVIMKKKEAFSLAKLDRNTKVLAKGEGIGSFIYKTNRDIYKTTRETLSFFEFNNNRITKKTYDDLLLIIQGIVNTFQNIYFNQTKNDPEKLEMYASTLNEYNFNEMNFKYTLGMPNSFIVSEIDINNFLVLMENLKQLNSKIKRSQN